jgi:hypothetical protein
MALITLSKIDLGVTKMISTKFYKWISLLILSALAGPAFSEELTAHRQIQISGDCVKCLIEIRNDMKRSHSAEPLDRLMFTVDEGGEVFEITVGKSSPRTKGGSITYKCSKHTGVILAREGGK